jgi:hypothetical protein
VNAPAIRLLAGALLGVVTLQFALAGLGVFATGAAWSVHREAGAGFALPLAALAWLVARDARLRRLRRPLAIVAGLYVLQFGWLALGQAAGLPAIQALHAVHGMALAGACDALFRATRNGATAIA